MTFCGEDGDFDYNSEEDSSPIEPDLEGKEIYSKDPFIMSFVDTYILGLTDHNIQVTASTFDNGRQRGFGHGGAAAKFRRQRLQFTRCLQAVV